MGAPAARVLSSVLSWHGSQVSSFNILVGAHMRQQIWSVLVPELRFLYFLSLEPFQRNACAAGILVPAAELCCLKLVSLA